jgi:hypothetical protein
MHWFYLGNTLAKFKFSPVLFCEPPAPGTVLPLQYCTSQPLHNTSAAYLDAFLGLFISPVPSVCHRGPVPPCILLVVNNGVIIEINLKDFQFPFSSDLDHDHHRRRNT